MSLPWRFVIGPERSRRLHFLSVRLHSGANHRVCPLPLLRMLTTISVAAPRLCSVMAFETPCFRMGLNAFAATAAFVHCPPAFIRVIHGPTVWKPEIASSHLLPKQAGGCKVRGLFLSYFGCWTCLLRLQRREELKFNKLELITLQEN